MARPLARRRVRQAALLRRGLLRARCDDMSHACSRLYVHAYSLDAASHFNRSARTKMSDDLALHWQHLPHIKHEARERTDKDITHRPAHPRDPAAELVVE